MDAGGRRMCQHDVDLRSPLLVGEGDDPRAAYAVGNTAYALRARAAIHGGCLRDRSA